ncbi:MAG: sn-glycerol-3-phosphate ABC transporter ATP-binding protein UgpC [Phycisphaerales bacterium]|nr:sn-glycerol-3-phosphate ABC transporter ATP-binding protein UgpC [Phycisphaerales bacterium]
MAQVVLESVSKIYPGPVKAVDNVSLTIADREFVVLVGPSGCGKSTTLRMVAGLEDISGGTIRIGDRVVNEVAPKDRDIAMVFQNYALYPHMTVYRNMAFALELRRKHGNRLLSVLSPGYRAKAKAEHDSIRKRVTTAAEMLGITPLLERRPKQLSGGQRQRVAVGRAIVRDPAVYLFDEPLSNLDAKLRVEMRGEIKRLHRRVNTTTIYVTHDQEEAMTLGDRVVVMKDGVVHQVATPFEVYEHPVNRFVAGFLGTPPMNFLEGRIVREGDRLLFDEGDNKLAIAPEHASRLQAFVDKPMSLGLRPELLTPAGGEGAGSSLAKLRATVRVTEPLGDRMDVRLATSKHDHIVARIDGRVRMPEGEAAEMAVDMRRAHFFEQGELGRNLTL